MPGILPMKMIRVGTTAQSRIAQACDRCRSKKIRCDGVRPCCTQCSSVGFECKTSDKLSRRAFPRGYTESLEDRVRALEAEVRDLKVLLDEKDEKLDMLSRIHNFSPRSRKSSMSPNASVAVKVEEEQTREDVILIELPVAVQPTECSNGTAKTAALIEAFEGKVHKSDRPCPMISASTLLKPCHLGLEHSGADALSTATPIPPRLLSDQYINIFFQEWQPLLPILHRPTFLRIYEQYLLDSDVQSWQKNKHAVAQLFLIFEISAHSSSSKTRPVTTVYDRQWRKALSAISSKPTIATIQSYLLAQLCCLLKADYSNLLHHRACAVSMVHQLYLHQGHKSHSLPVLEDETRKKVFWCQYVLDKFTSAATGTPQLLHDADISANFPADVDDENINAHGISPALPGEVTKISSAFALFRGSQILAKTLKTLYPSKSSYSLSVTKLHSLSDELDQWQEELPDHLRLRFCNDKPATNLVSCRSPLLSLAYFYIRSLIHRPLLYHGSVNAASAATIVLATTAKHELQILDLLDERSMNYTFPLCKQDLLLNAGFSVLWQTIGLDDDSKLIRDDQRSLNLTLKKLAKESQPASIEFRKIATNFATLADSRLSPTHIDIDTPAARLLSSMPAPASATKSRSTRKQLQAMASRLSTLSGKPKAGDGVRRASMSQPGFYQSLGASDRARSSTSLSSTKSAPILPTPPASTNRADTVHLAHASSVNLDYFPLLDDAIDKPSNNSSSTMLPPGKLLTQPGATSLQGSWSQFINGTHIEPDIGSTSPDLFTKSTLSASPVARASALINGPASDDWSIDDVWQFSAHEADPEANGPQSLLSFSEGSLTSSDEMLFSAAESHSGSTSTNDNS